MVKPAHTRVTFNGVIGPSGAHLDDWSFSLNFPVAALPDATTESAANDLAADWKNAWTVLADDMPTDVVLTQVKASRMNPDGTVTRRADGTFLQGVTPVLNMPGVLPPVAMPLQIALCVSLVTARAGATGKGRFFLPWPAEFIDTEQKVLLTVGHNRICDHVQDFVDNLALRVGQAPQVVSSKGYMSEVTALKIGRVPDTMRSRREDLPEGYLVRPLA